MGWAPSRSARRALAGYGLGAPLLYHSVVVPVALPTAAGLSLLGAGILATAIRSPRPAAPAAARSRQAPAASCGTSQPRWARGRRACSPSLPPGSLRQLDQARLQDAFEAKAPVGRRGAPVGPRPGPDERAVGGGRHHHRRLRHLVGVPRSSPPPPARPAAEPSASHGFLASPRRRARDSRRRPGETADRASASRNAAPRASPWTRGAAASTSRCATSSRRRRTSHSWASMPRPSRRRRTRSAGRGNRTRLAVSARFRRSRRTPPSAIAVIAVAPIFREAPRPAAADHGTVRGYAVGIFRLADLVRAVDPRLASRGDRPHAA